MGIYIKHEAEFRKKLEIYKTVPSDRGLCGEIIELYAEVLENHTVLKAWTASVADIVQMNAYVQHFLPNCREDEQLAYQIQRFYEALIIYYARQNKVEEMHHYADQNAKLRAVIEPIYGEKDWFEKINISIDVTYIDMLGNMMGLEIVMPKLEKYMQKIHVKVTKYPNDASYKKLLAKLAVTKVKVKNNQIDLDKTIENLEKSKEKLEELAKESPLNHDYQEILEKTLEMIALLKQVAKNYRPKE
jgi:hypothetical protein